MRETITIQEPPESWREAQKIDARSFQSSSLTRNLECPSTVTLVPKLTLWNLKLLIGLIRESTKLTDFIIDLDDYRSRELLLIEDIVALNEALQSNESLIKISLYSGFLGDEWETRNISAEKKAIYRTLSNLIANAKIYQQRNQTFDIDAKKVKSSVPAVFPTNQSPIEAEHLRAEETFIIDIPAAMTPIVKLKDQELDVEYYSDEIDSFRENDLVGYRASDISFIKFLLKINVLYFQEDNLQPEKKLKCKTFEKKTGTIDESCVFFIDVIRKIEEAYKHEFQESTLNQNNSIKYFDPDLLDDNFHHASIVAPYEATNEETRDDHAEYWGLNFKSRESMEDYYKNRSELFALYVFLRRIAILHRRTNFKKPFKKFKKFYNKEYIHRKLLAAPVQYDENHWNLGLHEWLLRAQFMEAFERTAGCRNNVNSHIPPISGRWKLERPVTPSFIGFHWYEFNWLDAQFLMRARIDNVIFRHNLEGHIGAVYSPEGNQLTKFVDKQTLHNAGFDTELKKIFTDSTCPAIFALRICNFFLGHCLHDNLADNFGEAQRRVGFTANGVSTAPTPDRLSRFQQLLFPKLKKERRNLEIWRRDLCKQSELAKLASTNAQQAGANLKVMFENHEDYNQYKTEVIPIVNSESTQVTYHGATGTDNNSTPLTVEGSATSTSTVMPSATGLFAPSRSTILNDLLVQAQISARSNS